MPRVKPRHKFRAVKTERHGIRFDSKKEARFYDHLRILQKEGEVLFFLRQAPFDLPGGKIHRVDYLVFYADGNAKFIEVKGFDHPVGKLKREQIESIYGIEIEVV